MLLRCRNRQRELKESSPGTHTQVRPGVVVVVRRGVSSSSSSEVGIDGAGDGVSFRGGAGVCLRTRTQTGQARAPRALWSAPYRLQPPQRHTHIPRAHGITVVTLLIVFVIPRGVTEVRRSRRMGNGAAKSVQFSQSPMTVLHDIVTGPDPKELVKKWKAAMRGESRKIDRNIRGPVWRVNPLHTRKST